jgi:hypothetical protein
MENKGAHAAVASGAAPQSWDKAAPSSRKCDLTLRAGVDGATARVPRGAVVAYARVLADALDATDCDELLLPGKSKTELDLLIAWLERREEFSVVRNTMHGACARTRVRARALREKLALTETDAKHRRAMWRRTS